MKERPAEGAGSGAVRIVWWALVISLLAKQALVALPGLLGSVTPVASADAAPMAHWAGIAGGLAALAAMGLAALGAGDAVARWIGTGTWLARTGPAATRLLAGLGTYALIAGGLGHTRLLFAPVSIVLAGMLAAAGARRVRRAPWRFAGVPASWSARWFMVLALAVGGVLALFALDPETRPDGLAYHLGAPQFFLKAHGRVDAGFDALRYPLLAEGLYAQGVILGGWRLPALLNLAALALACAILLRWARDAAGEAAGWIAVAGLLISEQVGFQASNLKHGSFAMAFVLLAVRLWSMEEGGRRAPRFALAGAAAAWALLTNYTAGVVGAGMAGLAVWRAARRGRWAGAAAMILGGCGIAAALLAGRWLFTGNPVYPFFFGGTGWSWENDELQDRLGCPGYDWSLRDPLSVAAAAVRLLVREQPLFLLAVPFLVRSLPRFGPGFYAAWGLAFLAWSAGVPCIRFALPLLPVLALIAAIALARRLLPAAEERGNGVADLGGIAIVTVAVAAGAVGTVTDAAAPTGSLSAAVGIESRTHYLRRTLGSYEEAVECVDRAVRGPERIAVVGDIRRFGFRPRVVVRDLVDRPFIYESVTHHSTPAGILKHLRQRRIGYVLHNWVKSEFHGDLTAGIFPWDPSRVGLYREFWRRHSEVVWRGTGGDDVNGGFILYRITARAVRPGERVPFLPGTERLVCRRLGESPEQYVERLERTLAAAPDVTFLEVRTAMALLAAGRPRAALRCLEGSFAGWYPAPDELHAVAGAAWRQLGDSVRAAAHFRRAAELRPDQPFYRTLLEECRSG